MTRAMCAKSTAFVKGKAEPVTLYESFDWRVGNLLMKPPVPTNWCATVERYRAQACECPNCLLKLPLGAY